MAPPLPLLRCLALLLLLAAAALAGRASFKGRFEATGVVPSSVRVRLNGGEHEAFVRADGRFAFADVDAGTHELSVVDPFHAYPRILVDIDGTTLKPKFYEIPNPASPTVRREMGNGLVIRPVAQQDYFEKRQQMSLLSMFMNPMVLIMVFTLVLGMAMPKLMENLDPKELEEMKRMQNQSRGDPSKVLAGLLSGKTEGEEEEEEEEEEEDGDAGAEVQGGAAPSQKQDGKARIEILS